MNSTDVTPQEIIDYQSWLNQEFIARCNKNKKYSLRAFAKLLDIDSSSLSQILSGRRKISVKMVARFADAIGVDPQLRVKINAQLNSKVNRKSSNEFNPSFFELTEDAFNIIADWYHYAILELLKIDGVKFHPKWIASQLEISTAEARLAIQRLRRLNLLKIVDGKYVVTQTQLTNAGSIDTSSAMKQLQRYVLKKALASIDEVSKERKDITSMTMAIDESKLPEAKQMIKKFRRQLSTYLEEGKPTAVFNLCIQLYPLTLKEIKNEKE